MRLKAVHHPSLAVDGDSRRGQARYTYDEFARVKHRVCGSGWTISLGFVAVRPGGVLGSRQAAGRECHHTLQARCGILLCRIIPNTANIVAYFESGHIKSLFLQTFERCQPDRAFFGWHSMLAHGLSWGCVRSTSRTGTDDCNCRFLGHVLVDRLLRANNICSFMYGPAHWKEFQSRVKECKPARALYTWQPLCEI